MKANEQQLRKMYENGYDVWLEDYLVREARELQLDAARIEIEQKKLERQLRNLKSREGKLEEDQAKMDLMREWRVNDDNKQSNPVS